MREGEETEPLTKVDTEDGSGAGGEDLSWRHTHSSTDILQAGSTNYWPLDIDQCVVFSDSGSVCVTQGCSLEDDSLMALNKSPLHTLLFTPLGERQCVCVSVRVCVCVSS